MKTVFIIVLALVVTVITVFFILGKQSQKVQIPGLTNGKLSKCSTKPNCVCSEDPNDVDHFIEPMLLKPENIDIKKIESTITEMGGTIIDRSNNYVSATFTSTFFSFVDDFEIRIEPESLLFRSGSRVGYSDRGENKKRVELFKQLYAK